MKKDRKEMNRLTKWVHATLGVGNNQGREYLESMQEIHGPGGAVPKQATIVYRSEVVSDIRLVPDDRPES